MKYSKRYARQEHLWAVVENVATNVLVVLACVVIYLICMAIVMSK